MMRFSTARARAGAARARLATPLLSLLSLTALAAGGCGEAPGDASGSGDAAGAREGSSVHAGERVYNRVCAQCHALGMSGAQDLATSVATSRARVDDFEAVVAELERNAPDLVAANRSALDAVLALEPGPERYAAWLAAYVANPRFDRTLSRMNRVSLSRTDLEALTEWLVAQP